MKKLNFLRRSHTVIYDHNFLANYNIDGFIKIPYTNEDFKVGE